MWTIHIHLNFISVTRRKPWKLQFVSSGAITVWHRAIGVCFVWKRKKREKNHRVQFTFYRWVIVIDVAWCAVCWTKVIFSIVCKSFQTVCVHLFGYSLDKLIIREMMLDRKHFTACFGLVIYVCALSPALRVRVNPNHSCSVLFLYICILASEYFRV